MVCFRYAGRIDIKSDTGFRNITWGLLPTGCQGVMRELPKILVFYFNIMKGVSTMILKVVGQVKGHKNKMSHDS